MNKYIVITGIIIIIAGAGVFIFLGNINAVVKKGITKIGPMILNAPVKLESVNISLLSGSGEIHGLEIGNPDGFHSDYAFRMNRLKIDLDVSSITSDKIHINSILIDSPKIMFEGKYHDNNLEKLQGNAKNFQSNKDEGNKNDSAEPQKESPEKKVQIDHLKIVNANIGVTMAFFYGKQLTIPFPSFSIKDIGKNKNASISDAIETILASLNQMVIISIRPKVTDVVREIRSSGSTLKQGLNEGFDKFKKLFD